jgi:hypothetical protein
MVKVHGHTGEPLHAVADAMATEGADRKMEVNERLMYETTRYQNPPTYFSCSKKGTTAEKPKVSGALK